MMEVLASKDFVSRPSRTYIHEKRRTPHSPTSSYQKKKKKTTTTTTTSSLSQNGLACVSANFMGDGNVKLYYESALVLVSLISCAFAGDMIERKTQFGKYLGDALSALLVGCFLASFTGVFTFSSNATTIVFDLIWDVLMPLGVTLALLNVKVSDFATQSKEVLLGFSFASVGSILATVFSFALFSKSLGALGYKIAACMCASYIGGSLNFAATAKALELTNANLLAASMAADNVLMAVFLGVLMVLPCKPPYPLPVDVEEDERTAKPNEKTNSTPEMIAGSAMRASVVATAILFVSSLLAKLSNLENFSLAITCIIAPFIGVLLNSNLDFSGSQFISKNIMLLFFACIGAGCNVFTAFAVGAPLFGFIFFLLLAQLLFALLFAKAFRVPLWATLIGLNASAGGPATAFAMAASKGWKRALQPAVLAGTIGYAIGTMVGCVLSVFLRATLAPS